MAGTKLYSRPSPWRYLVPAVLGMGLVLQVALSQAAQWQVRLGQSGRSSYEQTESRIADFVAFIQSHTSGSATMLYVTPDTRDTPRWTYIKVNYLLHPSTVWWVAPPGESDSPYPRIESPLTGEALTNVARAKRAQYVVIDGLDLPDGLAYSSVFQFSPQRLVLRLF